MTEAFNQAVIVTPGLPVKIGVINDGTLIMNNDPANGVWLAPNASVSPGNGIRIGPLGSVTWKGSGNVSACVDTGVVASVLLQITDAAVQPVSPLDVAIATATQLTTQGVPAKLLITDLGQYLNGTTLGVMPIDFTPYASLFIFATFTGATNPLLYYQFAAVNGVYVGQVDTLACNDANYIPGIIIPVTGKSLSFRTSAGTANIRMIGYNRSLSRVPLGNGFQSAGHVAASNNIIDQTLHVLTNSIGLPNQGYCYVSVQVSTPGTALTSAQTFNIGVQINGAYTYVFCTSSDTTISFGVAGFKGFLALPAVPYDFVIQCTSLPAHPLNVSIVAVPAYV